MLGTTTPIKACMSEDIYYMLGKNNGHIVERMYSFIYSIERKYRSCGVEITYLSYNSVSILFQTAGQG